jgi:hypothetical protein
MLIVNVNCNKIKLEEGELSELVGGFIKAGQTAQSTTYKEMKKRQQMAVSGVSASRSVRTDELMHRTEPESDWLFTVIIREMVYKLGKAKNEVKYREMVKSKRLSLSSISKLVVLRFIP